MEIIFIYLIVGALIASSLFLTADYRHWSFFLVFIAWLPLMVIGIIIVSFIDIEKISNRLNI
ncbi:hypothetical protein [Bacillus salacetis]|uniref:hypothetical protein n=1 Tax=Bacillus salacetis TaxID=2315464 RepID=UPI00109B829E|nr:hypothetical protein [Bacillus salacetis]